MKYEKKRLLRRAVSVLLAAAMTFVMAVADLPALGVAATAYAGTTSRTYALNASDMDLIATTAKTEDMAVSCGDDNYFTYKIATGSKAGADASSKSFTLADGTALSFTQRINTQGGASATSASIHFSVSEAAEAAAITVVASTGTAGRSVGLWTSAGTFLTSTEMDTTDLTEITFSLTAEELQAARDYYIGSVSSGIYIWYVAVEEEIAADDESEGSGEEPASANAISNAVETFDFTSSEYAGYTAESPLEDTTIGCMTIPAGAGIYYNDEQHGIIIDSTTEFDIAVDSGVTVVTFYGCAFGSSSVTGSSTTGVLQPDTTVTINQTSEAEAYPFVYRGEATTLSFQVTGSGFLHKIEVDNGKEVTLDAAAVTYNFAGGDMIGAYDETDSNKTIGTIKSDDGILTVVGNDTMTISDGHGATVKNGQEFLINVPAGKTTIVVGGCQWANEGVMAALYDIDGTLLSAGQALKTASCGEAVTFIATVDEAATLALRIEAESGQAYIHTLSVKTEAVKETATVSGAVSSSPEGAVLSFSENGSVVGTAAVTEGQYSVELPIGAKYDVTINGADGYKVSEGTVIDLTDAAANATVTADITLVCWDSAKAFTVTIGGTTFTVTPGAAEDKDFTVTAAGGDGSVELVTPTQAIIWANLSGSGAGTLSSAAVTGTSENVTVSYNGNTLEAVYTDASSLPSFYTLLVKDNSASGIPYKDGSVKNYSLGDGSIVSKLYDGTKKLSGGNSVTSADRLVTLTGNRGIYYNGTHGIYISDGDTIQVKVAGDATVTFAMCSYSEASATLTATAADETGTVVVKDTESNVAAMQVSSDGAGVTYEYTGPETTLTFTVSSPSGTSYIHSISVSNKAEETSTNDDLYTTLPSVLNIGNPGALTVTPNGQTLNLVQTGGSVTGTPGNNSTASFYAFPSVAEFYKLEVEVKVNSVTSSSTNYGVYVGAFDDDLNIVTAGIRNKTGLVGYYTKSATSQGTGQVSKTLDAGETIKFTVYKSDKFYIVTDGDSFGTYTSSFAFNSSSVTLFNNDEGSAHSVYYGLVLGGVDCDVTNMVYYDADGNVLFDQNEYYNPLGEAPVVTSVTAVAAADRTKIDVSWAGSDVYGDGKYVLQVSKDGGEYVDVDDGLTGLSYEYPVAFDASGIYTFRVCGTLGNTTAQRAENRNDYVVSNEAEIAAALETPTVTLPYTSSSGAVNLSWTESAGAASYEVYRRSSDETTAVKIGESVTTSYTDTTVTAEIPYYYSVKALSEDNFSGLSEECWTLPTNGHSGAYNYDDAAIAITKRSYNTTFTDTIAVIEGVATAPGTVSVEVNGTVVATAAIASANDTFSFTDIPVEQGRNDVTIYLTYNNGAGTTKKSLNYVYLTDYDYVVDAAYTGTAGDTANYGVPEYATIGEAIEAANGTVRNIILVKAGDYEERLDITKANISLIGEDSEKTVIHCYPGDEQWNLPGGDVASGSTNTSDRCAMYVEKTATGFTAENLTIQNDWNYVGDGAISNESAEALRTDADNAVYVNVRLLGYQDTLLANNSTHQYFYKCYIAGNVDFMWGSNSQVLFDDCDIVFRYNANKNSGYVTAVHTDEELTYGWIFNECRFTAEEQCSGSKYYLGRPYNGSSAVTFVNCYMSDIINTSYGYSTWSGGNQISSDPTTYATTRYYECGTYGPGYAVNVNRRQISGTQAQNMLSAAGLGWDPYTKAEELNGDGNYVGTKTTASNSDLYVETAYTSSSYSAFEGDDTGLGKYNLEGFAASASTTGGGLLKEDNENYYVVSTGNEFLDALTAIRTKNVPSVIEITADISLGNLEIENYSSYSTSVTQPHNPALTHPLLLETGVSKVYIKQMSNLTIFSSNGSSIKHAALDISGSDNIIIRNVKFDELWEWDEDTAGDYDTNDWDYVTIESGSSRIWIDHCTFYKAYDGVVDIKTNNASIDTTVTVSWCEFLPGSEDDIFFNQMMDAMAADPEAYPYYASLLESGMSEEQIWWYAYGQKKTHLLGQADTAVENVALDVTFANNYYFDSMDRMPRLRFGTAHVYNCIMDAQELYDARASITNAEAAKHIVSNGASSTCDGHLLIENSYMSGIINVLNSGNGSSPSGYINAINSLYYMSGERYKLEPKVNTTYEGATVLLQDADEFIAALPYSDYVLYDAAELATVVQPYTGAGKLELTTLQWEKTVYYDAEWEEPDDTSDYDDDEDLPEYDGSTDDGSTDDGSTDDGNTDDGNTDDGNIDDGSTDDGNTDDGNTDNGNTDDGSTDDGNTDNGNTDDGSTDDGNTDDGSTDDGNTDDGNTDDGNTDDSSSGDNSTADSNTSSSEGTSSAAEETLIEKAVKGKAEAVETDAAGTEYRRLTNSSLPGYIIKGAASVLPGSAYFTAEHQTSGTSYEAASKAVKEQLTGYNTYQVVDINLYNASGVQMHQMNGMVSVALLIPEGLTVSEGITLVVYRLNDNGTLTKCDTVVNGNYITFQTDHFSTFIIAAQTDAGAAAFVNTGAVNTGDNAPIANAIVLLFAGFIILAAYARKKRA